MKRLLWAPLQAGLVLTLSAGAQQLQHPVALSSNSNTMVSRAPDSRPWTDPALNHNRLLQNQAGEGVYILVGPYKVKGSPFLYGEKLQGDMFTPEAKAWNIYLSYNAYNQELNFYSTANPGQPLTREPGTVDSFVLHRDSAAGILQDIRFVSAASIGQKEKTYYQVLYNGTGHRLYKRYKADLGYVQDNITQSELRQFDIVYDYYYFNAETGQFKKLKSGLSALQKEFKGVPGIEEMATPDAWTRDPEGLLQRIFIKLNEGKQSF